MGSIIMRPRSLCIMKVGPCQSGCFTAQCCLVVTLLPSCFRHGPHEEEEVIYERLPSDISERFVLLLDPLAGTGRKLVHCLHHSGIHLLLKHNMLLCSSITCFCDVHCFSSGWALPGTARTRCSAREDPVPEYGCRP
eukprot:GHUV01056160.1.p1 GENE.GHUV01056160.1~~GHUV01056160.1.p1  ORF type:complete len:137 (-),score=6.86 GHUV01056160.1:23-433(-)